MLHSFGHHWFGSLRSGSQISWYLSLLHEEQLAYFMLLSWLVTINRQVWYIQTTVLSDAGMMISHDGSGTQSQLFRKEREREKREIDRREGVQCIYHRLPSSELVKLNCMHAGFPHTSLWEMLCTYLFFLIFDAQAWNWKIVMRRRMQQLK